MTNTVTYRKGLLPPALVSLTSYSYYLSPLGFRIRRAEEDMLGAWCQPYGWDWAPVCALSGNPFRAPASSLLAYLKCLVKMRKPSQGAGNHPHTECSSLALTWSWVRSAPEGQSQRHTTLKCKVAWDAVLVNKLSGTCLHSSLLEVRLCGLQCEY